MVASLPFITFNETVACGERHSQPSQATKLFASSTAEIFLRG